MARFGGHQGFHHFGSRGPRELSINDGLAETVGGLVSVFAPLFLSWANTCETRGWVTPTSPAMATPVTGSSRAVRRRTTADTRYVEVVPLMNRERNEWDCDGL